MMNEKKQPTNTSVNEKETADAQAWDRVDGSSDVRLTDLISKRLHLQQKETNELAARPTCAQQENGDELSQQKQNVANKAHKIKTNSENPSQSKEDTKKDRTSVIEVEAPQDPAASPSPELAAVGIPGAFACAGLNDTSSTQEDEVSEDLEEGVISSSSGQGGAPQSTSNMPVAHPVNGQDSALNLPRAQEETNRNNKEKQKTSRIMKQAMASAVVLLLITGIVLGAVLGSKSNEETATPSMSTFDSSALSSQDHYDVLVSSLFPADTLEALQDPNSPQSLASKWLERDLEVNHYNYTRKSTDTRQILQRFALATLYYSTGGDDWFYNANWLDHSIHECLWFAQDKFLGLTPNWTHYEVPHANPCEIPLSSVLNTNGPSFQSDEDSAAYKHLWLHSNGLDGYLPEELFWLTDLKSISLYTNLANDGGLQGSISSHIGHLAHLEAINLGGSRLSGSIPTELGLLSNSLASIILVNMHLEGPIPSEMGLLHQMHHFLAEDNFFTGQLPSELGSTNMSVLCVSNNRLTGTVLDFVTGLPLTALTLDQNQFSGTIPAEIGLLTDTKKLLLFNNQFSGLLPSELGAMSALGYLNLHNNRFSGAIPSELGQIPLKTVLLNDNLLTGSLPIEFLEQPKLDSLDVHNNPFLTGSLPANVSLSELIVTNTQISGVVPESLCEALVLGFDCGQHLCGCDCICEKNQTRV